MSSRCEVHAELIKNKPRWGGPLFGPIVRYINTIIVFLIFSFILKVLNSCQTIRLKILMNNIWRREKTRGLLTVSNHQSFYDDPGIWTAFLPLWRMRPEQVRWSLCTEDVFFAVFF